MIWPWRRFNLPDPPDLYPVWKIGSFESPSKPHPVDLHGTGRVSVVGWFTPVRTVSRARPGLKLYLNGGLLSEDDTGLVPEGSLEIYGAIGVTAKRRSFTEAQMSEIRAVVRVRIAEILDGWLIRGFAAEPALARALLEELLPVSDRLRQLCLEDLRWQRIVSEHFRFATTQGPKTLGDLRTLRAAATTVVHPVHVMLPDAERDRVIIDLRQPNLLEVFQHTSGIEDLLLADSFLASLPSRSRTGSLGQAEVQRLRRWLEEGLRKAGPRYRRVRVKVLSAEDLANRTALTVPSARTPRLRDWIATSVLCVNGDTELAHRICCLPAGNPADAHVPLIIHTYALLFAISDFASAWEAKLWDEVGDLLDLFLQLGGGDRALDLASLHETWNTIRALTEERDQLLAMVGCPR